MRKSNSSITAPKPAKGGSEVMCQNISQQPHVCGTKATQLQLTPCSWMVPKPVQPWLNCTDLRASPRLVERLARYHNQQTHHACQHFLGWKNQKRQGSHMINLSFFPSSPKKKDPKLRPPPGHLHLLLIELCTQGHLCKATTWGRMREKAGDIWRCEMSFGDSFGAFGCQTQHFRQKSQLWIPSPPLWLDGCVPPFGRATPMVRRPSSLPTSHGSSSRGHFPGTEWLPNHPGKPNPVILIAWPPQPAIYIRSPTSDSDSKKAHHWKAGVNPCSPTMKNATTCHHLRKHHPRISSHSRQRQLSTPQRRWDGLAPGKTQARCTNTKRSWLFQESEAGATSYPTRILPRTLRDHFLEEHACLIENLVAQRRRSHYHFNFLLLLSFQVPTSTELFNIKPFRRVPDTVPLSQRFRTIGEASGFTQARRTCATLPVAFEKTSHCCNMLPHLLPLYLHLKKNFWTTLAGIVPSLSP